MAWKNALCALVIAFAFPCLTKAEEGGVLGEKADRMALYQKASSLMKEERLEEAKQHLLRIVESDPRFAPAYYSLGVIQLRHDDMEGAVDYFQTSIDCGARDASIYYLMASALVRHGDFDKAKEAYLEAIKIKPGMANAHHDLGVLYYRTAAFENSVKSFENALSLDSSSTKSMLMLGVAYIKDGKPENAVELVTSLRAAQDEIKALQLENLLREAQEKREISEPDVKQLAPGGGTPAADSTSGKSPGKVSIKGNATITMNSESKSAQPKRKSPFAR